MQENAVDELDTHLNIDTLSRSVGLVFPTYVPPFSQMPDVVVQTLFTIPFFKKKRRCAFHHRGE